MMICMPMRMWFVTDTTHRIRSSATSGCETTRTASGQGRKARVATMMVKATMRGMLDTAVMRWTRSEEHTSELQSRQYLVCRLLLEKKKHEHEYPFLLHLNIIYL